MVPVSVELMDDPEVDQMILELAQEGAQFFVEEKGMSLVEGTLHEVSREPVGLAETEDGPKIRPLHMCPESTPIRQWMIWFEAEAEAA